MKMEKLIEFTLIDVVQYEQDSDATDCVIEAKSSGKVTSFVYQVGDDGVVYLGKTSDASIAWDDQDFPLSYEDLLATVKTYVINV